MVLHILSQKRLVDDWHHIPRGSRQAANRRSRSFLKAPSGEIAFSLLGVLVFGLVLGEEAGVYYRTAEHMLLPERQCDAVAGVANVATVATVGVVAGAEPERMREQEQELEMDFLVSAVKSVDVIRSREAWSSGEAIPVLALQIYEYSISLTAGHTWRGVMHTLEGCPG